MTQMARWAKGRDPRRVTGLAGVALLGLLTLCWAFSATSHASALRLTQGSKPLQRSASPAIPGGWRALVQSPADGSRWLARPGQASPSPRDCSSIHRVAILGERHTGERGGRCCALPGGRAVGAVLTCGEVSWQGG